MHPGAAVYKGAAVLGIHPGLIFLAAVSLRNGRGSPFSVPQLFVDAPSRVDLTMAPDCVLAIRHAGSPDRSAHVSIDTRCQGRAAFFGMARGATGSRRRL